MEDKPSYTVDEVGEIVGRSGSRLRQMLNENRDVFPGTYKAGNTWQIPKKALEYSPLKEWREARFKKQEG